MHEVKNYKSLTALALLLMFFITAFCMDSISVFAADNIDNIPITSYDAFRNFVIGKKYDVDGYPTDQPYQCFDGAAILWKKLGRNLLTGGNDAKGTWLNARSENAGNDFLLISDINQVKRGDVVVFDYYEKCFNGIYYDSNGNLRKPGHIAYADNDYAATHTLNIFGQNQNGVPSFTLQENVPVNSFLGAFRFKIWADLEPPTMTSQIIKISNITGKRFDVSFNVKDNVGIGEVYIKLMTSAGSRFGNFATSNPIQGTYDPSSMTASVSVELSDLNILSDLYYVTCYGKDLSGNISDPLRLKDPISPFFVSPENCGQYKALKDTPVLNYPGSTAYPGANQATNEKIAKGEKVNVLGTITIDGVRYHKIEANQYEGETGSLWVKADDMEYYESLIAKIWKWIQDHADELICYFGHKVISLGGDGTLKQSGIIITSAKEAFSPDYVESLADSGTAIIPQENTEYSIEFITVDGEIAITIAGYQGYGGNVTVPSEIGGYRVAAIKSGAFSNCSNIVSITLPEGITSIPDNCFRNCISLTRTVLPATLNTIGSNAFYECKWLTEPNLPEGIKEIGANAFSRCSALTEIVIPDSVSSLGADAFNECTGLTSVTIPITADYDCGKGSYTNASFFQCRNVEEIHYTKGIGDVMQYADNGGNGYVYGMPYLSMSKLTTVTLEDGITEIPESFLRGCRNVEGVVLPKTIKKIGAYAFYECKLGPETEIPSGLEELGRYAFYTCVGLTSIEIPSGITQIPEYCFNGCTGLTQITIPEGVIEIDGYAFQGCSTLPEIVIPDSVSSIGADAFDECTGLTRVTIPITADYDCGKGSYTRASFFQCRNVEEIHYTKGIGDVMQYADNGVNGYVYGMPYLSMSKLTTVTLEDGITEIPESFLRGCRNVEGVVLPKTIKKIGAYAFYECKLGPETEIPSGLEELGRYAFYTCVGLTSIEIPSGITQIPEYCFNGCKGATELVIPDSVSSIGADAFRECTGLTSVTIPITTAYDCGKGLDYEASFYQCANVEEIHYTKGSGEVMQYAENTRYSSPYMYGLPYYARSKLTTVMLEDGITEIPESFLRSCSNVEGVVLPKTIKKIGSYAFYGCKLGPETEIPSGLEELGSHAFYGCVGLTSIEIPSGITQIPEYCFYGCKGLTKFTISESVTGIEGFTFQSCSALTEIVIPDSVSSIGADAFRECTGLTSVTIPITTAYDCGKGLDYEASFYQCANVEEIHYTKGSGEVMQYADNSRYSSPYVYGLPYYARSKLTTVTLEDGITEIPESFLRSCSNVKGVVLPDTIKKIGSYAFYGCKLGPETKIPSGLEELGRYAFYTCVGLTSIEIPFGITQIPEYCFYGCTGLTEVTISESVTEIEGYAFRSCRNINTVYLPFSTDIISSFAFNECTGLSDVYFNGSEMEAGGIWVERYNAELNSATWHYALENPNEDFSLKLPEQLKVIEEEAFTGMSAQVIIIPATVENIKAEAFVGCTDLKAIIFEGSPQSIANDIVNDPENVTVLVIKDSDTEAWARQAGFRVKYNLNR